MYVCMWPLLKLLDLAVLVVLWWCKTRRGAILAVLVVFWGSGGKIGKIEAKRACPPRRGLEGEPRSGSNF